MEALIIPRRRRGRTFFCGQGPRFLPPHRGVLPAPPSLFGGEAAPLKIALPSADHSAPQARPNLFLRPRAALFTPSKRGASGPTISFLEKEMVPPGGTREKSSGPSSWSSYLKLKCAPTPHSARRTRLHPARWGSRGTIQPSSVARVLDPPGAFLLDRSSGPFSFCGKKRMGGWGHFPKGKKEVRPLAAKLSSAAPAARNIQRLEALLKEARPLAAKLSSAAPSARNQ